MGSGDGNKYMLRKPNFHLTEEDVAVILTVLPQQVYSYSRIGSDGVKEYVKIVKSLLNRAERFKNKKLP